MARVFSSLFQSDFAVICMAQYLACNEVKAGLRASGIKVHQVSLSEIKQLARDYVIEHPLLCRI